MNSEIELNLTTEAELKRGKAIAFQRLNRRESSSKEVSKFLLTKKFSPEIISLIILELTEKNYLNDDRYARMLIREQVLRGKGPLWIKMKLSEKGIQLDRTRILELVSEFSTKPELELAKEILARKYPKAAEDPKTQQKALQCLIRRGFSYSIARSALAASKEIP